MVKSTEHRRFISPVRIKNKSLAKAASPTPSILSTSSAAPSGTGGGTACPAQATTSTPTNSSTSVRRKITRHQNRLDAKTKNDARDYFTCQTLSSPLRSERGAIPTAWDTLRSVRATGDIPIANTPTGPQSLTHISYNEKRNPLADTRLSCYKPKANEKYSLPAHYKSVDDFLFLNSNEDNTSSDSSVSSSPLDDKKRVMATATAPSAKCDRSVDQLADTPTTAESSLCIAQRRFGRNEYAGDDPDFKLTTKSVENICDSHLYDDRAHATAITPNSNKKMKRPNMTQFSDKIKTMSSRTQKLFARIYHHGAQLTKQQKPVGGGTPASNDAGERKTMFGIKAATCRMKMPKSRRSLSFGNIPDLEDFKQVLKEIDQLDDDGEGKRQVIQADAPNMNNHKQHERQKQPAPLPPQHRLHDDVKDDLLDECEDTDSGILVNESGQSSIIETDEVFLPDVTSCTTKQPRHADDGVDLRQMIHEQQDVNAHFEFKFVRLPLDISCGLGIGLKAIINDATMNKRIAYQVANVADGGMVQR